MIHALIFPTPQVYVIRKLPKLTLAAANRTMSGLDRNASLRAKMLCAICLIQTGNAIRRQQRPTNAAVLKVISGMKMRRLVKLHATQNLATFLILTGSATRPA